MVIPVPPMGHSANFCLFSRCVQTFIFFSHKFAATGLVFLWVNMKKGKGRMTTIWYLRMGDFRMSKLLSLGFTDMGVECGKGCGDLSGSDSLRMVPGSSLKTMGNLLKGKSLSSSGGVSAWNSPGALGVCLPLGILPSSLTLSTTRPSLSWKGYLTLPTLDDLNNRNILSHNSRGYRFKIKVQPGWFSGKGSPSDWKMTSWPHLTWITSL